MLDTMDTSGTFYSAAQQLLDQSTMSDKMKAMQSDQQKRRKLGDSPSDRSMQLMPPATRDLLGSGGYGIT